MSNANAKAYPALVADLIVLVAMAVGVYLLSGAFDVFEFIYREAIEFEVWQFDEIFVVCIFLAIAFGVFSLRRWRESVKLLTEREQSMIDLRAAKLRAEEANRAKGEFLANMSHEIRTPMNAIMGMTDLTLDTPLSDEQRENLRMVQFSAQSLLQLLNDILDFSKIEAGKLELSAAPFELRDAVGETVKCLSIRAHEKGVELACHVSPRTPDNLVGDALRLRQVLVNLLGNAIKFTDHGEAVISVHSEPVAGDQVRLHFSVRDTGVGIPVDQQRLIFEAFTQADGSSTRRFGGTGLGLAIATRLISRMGGHIWVESEVGKGSTFHFTAVFGLAGAATRPAALEIKDLAGLRVLIVDDNATNRLILEETIAGWRLRPTSVDSGAAALEALNAAAACGEPFALVLLDAMMPGMDGYEVARRWLAERESPGAAIMMLSSADSDDDMRRCQSVGVSAYLRKPIVATELYKAVATALGRAPAAPKPSAKERSASAQRGAEAPLNILLAEDNLINQRVTMGVVQKRGHSIQAVLTGKEALEALACQRFDLVLMDLQMPDMNGLEAATAIRERERTTGEHIPIIAMTAHAMKGDRERCLDAGMDDYLAKPVEGKLLHEMIARWKPGHDHGSKPAPSAAVESSSVASVYDAAEPSPEAPVQSVRDQLAVFDLTTLRRRIEDDGELIAEMIDLYLSSSPLLLQELETSVGVRDGERIARAAHTLKGVLKNMCADSCAAAALDLELVAKSGGLDGADEFLHALTQEAELLRSALTNVTLETPA